MQNLLTEAQKRRSSLPNKETTAFRLFDGLGDGMEGIEIDEFSSHWLISTKNASIPKPLHEALKESGRSVYHKRLDQHQKESPTHIAGLTVATPFSALENGARFELSFQSGYSQGIFLDQRDNRLKLHQRLGKGDALLNTFAYTGAFSVMGALAGATTTTLDLSQPYLDWAKRNMSLNQIDPETQYFCKGDTFHWLKRFAKQGRKFSAIVLDPPTFSRDHAGKVFRVEKHYDQLVALADACLTPDGTILASTNCRQLDERRFMALLRKGLNRPARMESSPMPFDFTNEPYLKSVWIS